MERDQGRHVEWRGTNKEVWKESVNGTRCHLEVCMLATMLPCYISVECESKIDLVTII